MAKAIETPKVYSTAKPVPVGSLKPNKWNPNVMSPDMLASLMVGMQRDGFIGALLVQKGKGVIIDGEHRWICAKRLGMKSVPAIELAVDDAKAKELTIALNQKRGYFDEEKLAALVQEIAEASNLPRKELQVVLGLTGKEIDIILDDISSEAEKEVANALENEGGKAKGLPKPKSRSADLTGGDEDDPPEALAEEGESPNYEKGQEGEEVVGDGNPEDKPGNFPITFYAPTLRQYEEMRLFFLNGKDGVLDFSKLQEVVDTFHQTDADAFAEFCEKASADGGLV